MNENAETPGCVPVIITLLIGLALALLIQQSVCRQEIEVRSKLMPDLEMKCDFLGYVFFKYDGEWFSIELLPMVKVGGQ